MSESRSPTDGVRIIAARLRRRALGMLLGAGLLPLALTSSPTPAAASGAQKINTQFCNKLGHSIQASSGAQMYCFGAQLNGSKLGALRAQALATGSAAKGGKGSGSNVNAASLAEDVSPSGARAYGQSEVSIASAGSYVVEAWNDATGFFSPCPSPANKEELTGFGFSNDGGKTFTDLGGLPNFDCATSRIEGDPSVEAYTVGGSTYFYISSIFIPFTVPENALSVTACKVTGSGSAATLACGQPIVAAISSDCATSFGFTFCSFLDKEFLSIDPQRGRLYMSYTEFGVDPTFGFSGTIELAACDLTKDAANPTCYNGSQGSGSGAPPYFVVAPGDPAGCENEGAYPAVDTATGDVYVAYEHNWASNISGGCFNPNTFIVTNPPTQNVLNRVPFSCLTLPSSTSPCAEQTTAVNIVSMDAAFIPGYNRFPMNDFPRIAVSNASGTVSMVWNDAGAAPLGDILLQSYGLGTLLAVQAAPVRINSGTGGANFLPGLRNVDQRGKLQVSWYSRTTANTALTDVTAASVDPRASGPGSNKTVTNVSSDWNAVSSDIIPNFGDYTDNYAAGGNDYAAWSDGRLGEPQPFSARR